MFKLNFIWFWISFRVWKWLGKFWKSNWDWGVQNWDFGMKKWVFHDSQLSVLATASKLAREASNMVTVSHVCPPRRAKQLATASIVSQGACFARHDEQRGDRGGTLPAMARKSLGRRVALVPVFLFCILCPFYIFLFWINSWYKH